MNILTPIAAALTLIALGFTLKKRRLSERNILLLAIFLVAALLWDLSIALPQLPIASQLSPGLLSQLPNYGILLLGLLFFQLTFAFVRRTGPNRLGWVLGVVWLVVCMVLIENWFKLPDTPLAIGAWPVRRDYTAIYIEAAGWFVLSLMGVIVTWQARRRAPNPLHRNRLTYWALPLGLSITGSGLYLADQTGLGAGVYLLAALLASWILPAHHLPDARSFTRRWLARLLGLTVALLVYAALLYGVLLLLQRRPFVNLLAASVALALTLVLAFNPLLRWVQNLLARRINGRAYDPAQALEQYSQHINNILDLQALTGAIMAGVDSIFRPRAALLFIVATEEGPAGQANYRLTASAGLLDPADLEAAFPSHSALISRLYTSGAPLTQYDIDLLPEFASIADQERAWFARLNADVYVPVMARGCWIGLLALGPKRSGNRYDEGDLNFLRSLARQTGIVLENARLYDDLVVRNAENERLNRELMTANRELARLDQAKSDFIDIASHELRTPLTQVRGYNDILIEMLAEGDLRPEMGLNLAENVRKATNKLEEIVDTMFDVSRLDSQTLELEKYSTTMAGIVKQAAENWTNALSIRKQTLQLEGLSELPQVRADTNRIRQVFSNLIQNAIKYTPDGGKIFVRGKLLAGSHGKDSAVEVVVADTGIGIAPEDLDRVFEKFFRAGDALRHSTGDIKFKGGGPGLGLTIAKGIVEAHGGRIWVESPGCDERACPGSCFHVVLPLENADS